jgi:hypothetical protein
MKLNIKSKKAQEQKSKILAAMPKKAQEEMVGFAMIVIIVAIVLLIFLGISINKPKTQAVESYEVESFIQAMLQHTTECSMDYGFSYEPMTGLITECDSEQICYNEKSACDVLNSTLKDILEKSWKTGEDRPLKGYELGIISKDRTVLNMTKGNMTNNYKGSIQDFVKKGVTFSVSFRAYY